MAQGKKAENVFVEILRLDNCSQLGLIQNGKLYFRNVSSDANSSVLLLKGSTDEIGNYTCHWNNSLGEARFKQFNVTYVGRTEMIVDTAIAVSVPLAILLLISIIVAVRFYFLKVN